MSRPFALTLTMPMPTTAKELPFKCLENQAKQSKLKIRLVNLVIQVREFFSTDCAEGELTYLLLP